MKKTSIVKLARLLRDILAVLFKTEFFHLWFLRIQADKALNKRGARSFNNAGFGLVEILIAASIITIALSGLMTTYIFAFRILNQSATKERASFLLEEGVEVIRRMRDASWSTNIAPLTVGTTYYLVFDPALPAWGLAAYYPPAIAATSRFTQTVLLNDVYRRNIDDDIIDISSTDPKTLDPNTKFVTITVSWPTSSGNTISTSISTYITNLFQN